MFAITPAHEAGFEDYRRERFIEELALGSYDFIADDAPFLTKDQRLTGARFIYQSAENADYETRGGCFFWLNMAVLFGSHFSSDPQFGIIAPRHGQTGGRVNLRTLAASTRKSPTMSVRFWAARPTGFTMRLWQTS